MLSCTGKNEIEETRQVEVQPSRWVAVVRLNRCIDDHDVDIRTIRHRCLHLKVEHDG